MEVAGGEILVDIAHVNEVVRYTLPLRNWELSAQHARRGGGAQVNEVVRYTLPLQNRELCARHAAK